MKYFITIIIFIFTTSYSQSGKSGWNKNIEISHQGITRYFDVFVPENLKMHPELVIQLHGGTQSKDELYGDNSNASQYWKDVAENNFFLLIVPNGTDLSTGLSKGNNLNWNDCRKPIKNDKQADDVGFISKMIDWSVTNYKVNDKKVYVTGVSNGGFMAYRLALELTNKITAIASFAANFPKESECHPSGIVIPVMIVNGTKDKFIPFDGGITKFKKENILSSQETIDFWIINNGLININPSVSKITDINLKDKSTIEGFIYRDEMNSIKLSYYIVNGGGHNMPGKKYVLTKFIQKIVGRQNQDIEGAEIAWDFFKSISK